VRYISGAELVGLMKTTQNLIQKIAGVEVSTPAIFYVNQVCLYQVCKMRPNQGDGAAAQMARIINGLVPKMLQI
jgi:hypothetical protein